MKTDCSTAGTHCLKPSGWMSTSKFVWLFGFRYAFPHLGWIQVLPLPYGQIRIINRSHFGAHFDIREQDCNWRILENIHSCLPRTALWAIYFHLTWKETRKCRGLFEVWSNIKYITMYSVEARTVSKGVKEVIWYFSPRLLLHPCITISNIVNATKWY